MHGTSKVMHETSKVKVSQEKNEWMKKRKKEKKEKYEKEKK
jgi:hypothetical protein